MKNAETAVSLAEEEQSVAEKTLQAKTENRKAVKTRLANLSTEGEEALLETKKRFPPGTKMPYCPRIEMMKKEAEEEEQKELEERRQHEERLRKLREEMQK